MFHINAAGAATDFVNTFQSVHHFYNEINLLKSYVKPESEVSSNSARYNATCHKEYIKYLLLLCVHFSGTNGPKINENVLPDSRNEVQKLRQNELDNDEQMHSKVEECKPGPSSSKAPILRISSTSHTIHKLKKKTLNIL